jgi:DNA-binding response OmpR family regulator
VDIHHGRIELDSTPGHGSRFIVFLPCEEKSYSKPEIIHVEINYDETRPETNSPGQNLPVYENELSEKQKKYNLPHLLIVEDNYDLRKYLAGHFREKYKVSEAADGKEGISIAIENEPDIIISDVLMPNINGYEMCRKIRENFNTSHIPFIMLTANNTTEQKVEGLESGADVYIPKPFEIEYLDAVLNSLLLSRKRIIERFMGIEPVKEDSEKIPLSDIRFMNTLKGYILENIDNPDISIDRLSRELAVSRVQLNRKVKALTGQTPNNFVKMLRLKKAYELIKNQGIRVSDAAFLTGFSDPNYFTVCFKKEFGVNPSQLNQT